MQQTSSKSTNTSKHKSWKTGENAAKDQQDPEPSAKKFKFSVLSDETNETKTELHRSNVNQSFKKSSVSRINKSLEIKNNTGKTLLYLFCGLGKIDKVIELLEQGANTNTKDDVGWTPLHEAVRNRRLDLVRLLLQYNTYIDVPGKNNETPLHVAIRYNRRHIAELLVQNGADINARNCYGETPFELASAKFKNILLAATDNIIQTLTVNINHLTVLYSELDMEDIRVYCISKCHTILNKLKSLVESHPNLHIEMNYSEKVTHIIVDAEDNGVCQSSLEILKGIVNSVWILTSQWVMKSNEDKLEPFESYEVTGVGSTSCQGPKNSRHNKYKQLPSIFDGCQFYFHNFNTKYKISKQIVVTKDDLMTLVYNACGVFLRRAPNPELILKKQKRIPYHAKKGGKLANCSHYIIFKENFMEIQDNPHLKALPIAWFIECIEKYELLEPL